MNRLTDPQLLRNYTEHRSEAAFTELVRRHVDLVHSAALRMVCDSHLAEDVTQGVFVALAQNARQLTDHPVLSGWLHRTTQNLAAKAVRSDVHRRAREQEAATMNELLSAEPNAVWEHIAPQLDAALGELGETDRDALLLRYFERKSASEMATTLGISDEAAQKRVRRAVERLREFFAKRGLTVGASGLVAVIAANAVQAAPVGLAVTISTAVALAGTTIAATATATVTKAIAMTALQKTLVATIVAILAGAGIYEVRQKEGLQDQIQSLQHQQAQLANERDEITRQLAVLGDENERLNRNTIELLKLRSEVGDLRKIKKEPKAMPPALANQTLQSSTAPSETTPQGSIPKESWVFSGYSTPEAALQSVAWAMSRGDVKAFLASLTPEAQQSMEQQFSGKSQSELEASLRDEVSGIGALRPDWKRDSSAAEVTFVLFTKQEDNGATKVKDDAVLKFKNIGGEWKCAY